MSATPEELAVIEAAREMHNFHNYRDRCDCVVCSAFRALGVSRAPKKMLTLEERTMDLLGTLGECPGEGCAIGKRGHVTDAIHAAESAAWDRAIEAVAIKAMQWRDGAHRGSYVWLGDITGLKGKCHGGT